MIAPIQFNFWMEAVAFIDFFIYLRNKIEKGKELILKEDEKPFTVNPPLIIHMEQKREKGGMNIIGRH